MKEYEKSPEKELNEINSNNLSEIEFKVMVIWRLNSMKKDIETIKKDLSKIKNVIFEMKNTLEGTKSRLDEPEDQTRNLKDKTEKKHQVRAAKRKENLNEGNIRDLWDNMKHKNPGLLHREIKTQRL